MDTIPLSVSQRFERRIGVTVKSVWVRREEKEEEEVEEVEDSAGEKGAIRDLCERIRDWE